MPTLGNMFSRINRLTSYQVNPDDIWAAINETGFLIYSKVLKENRGFFIKFDTTSITLIPGTAEYTLPADATDVLHLAERSSPTDAWHTITPASLNDVLNMQQDDYNYFVDDDMYSTDSEFQFYGPYVNSIEAIDTPDMANVDQLQKIQISPQVDITRAVQIVYAAKWLPILSATDKLMMPEEGTHALFAGTMATLTGDIDDTRDSGYNMRFKMHLDGFLSWVRDRQVQQGPRVTPYL